MDSAPVKANASMDSLVEKEVLDDGDGYADELAEDDGNNATTVSAARKTIVDNQHRGQANAYGDMPGPTSRNAEFTINHTQT